MSNPSLAPNNEKINHILSHLRELREMDAIPLVKLAYSLGATEQQVADALGISKQLVNLRYNKNCLKGGEKE